MHTRSTLSVSSWSSVFQDIASRFLIHVRWADHRFQPGFVLSKFKVRNKFYRGRLILRRNSKGRVIRSIRTRSWSVVLRDTLNFLRFATMSETASPWSVARSVAASPSRSHQQSMQSSDLPRQQRIIRRASLGCRPQLAEEEGMCTRARHVRDRFLQVCVRDGFDRSIDLLASFSTGIFCWIRLRWTGRTVRARTT
jgi:hypothetical protein